MLEVYRILSGNHLLNKSCRCEVCPTKEMLQRSVNTTTRGHSLKLETQLATGHRRSFFAARVVKDWNALSESTVSAKTISGFKAGLTRDWSDVSKFVYNF